MKHRSLIGIFAVAIGLVALFQNLRVIQVTQEFLLALIFIFIGVIAFVLYKSKRKNPTALLVGILSIFWGIGLLLSEFGFLQREYKSIILMIGIGLSFGAIYFNNMQKWWAVIPAGVFLVIGIVNSLDVLFYIHQDIYSFLIFFGFGLTFLYLYLIRDEKRRLHWAIYPASGLILFSLVGFFTNSQMRFVQIFFGVLFILSGVLYIFRSSRKRNMHNAKPESNQSSSEAARNKETS